MKKFVATFLLIGTAVSISACSSTSGTGHYDEAPYADERTVGHEPKRTITTKEPTADKIFARQQVK